MADNSLVELAKEEGLSLSTEHRNVGSVKSSERLRFPSSERMQRALSEREERTSDIELSLNALELQLLKEEEMSNYEDFDVCGVVRQTIMFVLTPIGN